MALSPDQIKALLAKPARVAGSKSIDTSVRDFETWFKLAHKILDKNEISDEDGCDNVACEDPRVNRTILIADVDGISMCRHCFLAGYAHVG